MYLGPQLTTSFSRYIFTADGKHLLGGMMVGDTSDYIKLVDLVRKKVSDLGVSIRHPH